MNFGKYINFREENHFGIIILNRIHRANAFTIEQLENLKKAIEYCQENDKIKGLILTNEGTSFSTGMDLDYIDGSDHEAVKKLEGTAAEICRLLWDGKPSICAVNGRTMGEGVVFTACCDYKIATKESFFYMPEILSGIFPGTGCIVLFSRTIGIPWTKKSLMFAEKISAEKALEINLIDEIVSDKTNLIKTALERAKYLSSKNQIFLNAVKISANHLRNMDYFSAYLLAGKMYCSIENKIFFEKLKKRLLNLDENNNV
ncbi:MAG: enoyl-CoA hydratase/isomerase family protein [Promethearchaeota archaeon]